MEMWWGATCVCVWRRAVLGKGEGLPALDESGKSCGLAASECDTGGCRAKTLVGG